MTVRAITRRRSLLVVGNGSTLSRYARISCFGGTDRQTHDHHSRCSTPNTDLESLVSDAKARNVYFTAAQVSKAMKTWRKNKAAAKVR